MAPAPRRRPRRAAAARALGLALALLAAPLPAAAQVPPDAAGERVAAVRAGPIAVLHAEGDAGFARAVAGLAEAAHERIRRELGLRHEVEAAVLLLTPNSPERAREYWAGRLPRWMAGAAIPPERFIVVRVAPGRTPQQLRPVLAHELVHVILAADYPRSDGWPLWFREGLAMRHERGEGVRDYVTLSAAALFDRLVPFDELAVRFPPGEAEARLAYAQSASFVGFVESRYGRARFLELMHRLRRHGFDAAFRATYGMGPGAAEGEWLRWASRRYAWIPAVTSGTSVWLLITLLSLVAIAARRRKSRLMRERWEAEDREDGFLD